MFDIDSTRKHYLPQFYLRGFKIPGDRDQIYVYDKQRPERGIRITSIANVEVSKDAYSVNNDRILTEQESMWARILYTLDSGDVDSLNAFLADRERSDSLRQWLSHFVVVSALRSHGYRMLMSKETQQMFAEYKESMRDVMQQSMEGRQLTDRLREIGQEQEDYIAMIESILHLDNFRKWLATHCDPFIRGEIGQAIYQQYVDGSWRFYECVAGRTYLTADLPSHTFALGPEPQYRNYRWFTMPISSKLFLLGMMGDATEASGLASLHEEWTSEDIDRENIAMYEKASRFVYSPSVSEVERVVNLH